MITVEINEANFEYDIHSLVKAFYPEQDVLVRVDLTAEERERACLHLMVSYEKDTISFSFYEGKTLVRGGAVSVDFSNRAETKNRLKQKLYQLLSAHTESDLPWGTLTGIRPTKIPMAMLEEGASDDEIRRHMAETYFASAEKIDLSLSVAKRELALLSKLDVQNGYSLYVGIPFCPSTCLYCSFTSYPIGKWENQVDAYLDALEKELIYTAQACKDKVLNTVYIGGGTPTALSPAQLKRLIETIGTLFHLFDEEGKIVYGGLCPSAAKSPNNRLLEFTVEAGRPDSITQEKLAVLRDFGISRISINPQTMKEETLKLIGRRHSAVQTVESFQLARDMGFDNINMDLIVGLPGETLDDVRRTMEALAVLQPDNVTIHSLAIKRAARLRMEQAAYAQLGMENTWETIALTANHCRNMGLSPYYLYRQKNMAGNFENVGYAAPGKAGIYNILIMEEKQTIMALGAGATTKLVSADGTRIERSANVKDITQYLTRVEEMIERKKALLAQF